MECPLLRSASKMWGIFLRCPCKDSILRYNESYERKQKKRWCNRCLAYME